MPVYSAPWIAFCKRHWCCLLLLERSHEWIKLSLMINFLDGHIMETKVSAEELIALSSFSQGGSICYFATCRRGVELHWSMRFNYNVSLIMDASWIHLRWLSDLIRASVTTNSLIPPSEYSASLMNFQPGLIFLIT